MLEFEILYFDAPSLCNCRLDAGIRTPPQSNMPIKGNALKTSFQHLELYYMYLSHILAARRPESDNLERQNVQVSGSEKMLSDFLM